MQSGNRRISPTRLRLYEECPTKYWYSEVHGLHEQKHWHVFGTYAHRVAESVLSDQHESTEEDLSRIASQASIDTDYAFEVGQAFAYLTRQIATDISCEHSIRVELPEGFYDCQLDVLGRTHQGQLVVGDHKTSINPYKYAKSEAQLREDLQAQLYAYAAMYKTGENSVLAHWHWLPRNRCAFPASKAIVTEVLFTREELEEVAKKYCRLGKTLLGLDQRPTPGWVQDPWAMLDVCEAFGGCPYYERCRNEEVEMSLLATLGLDTEAVAKPAKVNPEPESVPVTAVTPEDDKSTDSGDVYIDRLREDYNLCHDKGYDLATYLRVTYNL